MLIRFLRKKTKLPRMLHPLMKFSTIILLGVILLFSVFNVYSIISTQRRRHDLQNMALANACLPIEDFIISTIRIGNVIRSDTQLMAFTVYQNYRFPHNIVAEIRKISAASNALCSLGIVYVNSPYSEINNTIYSDAGCFSYAGYAANELCGSYAPELLRSVIYRNEPAHFVPSSERHPSVLLYAMPIPSSYLSSPGKILFHPDYNTLTSGLNSSAGRSSDIYLMDAQNDLLLYFGVTYDNDLRAAREAIRSRDVFSGKVLFTHTLGNSGLHVVQTLDFWDYYQSSILSVLMLVLVGIFIALFSEWFFYNLARNTAKPFSALVQRASQINGEQDLPENACDEITQLSCAFDNMLEQHSRLTALTESRSRLEESQYLLFLFGVRGSRDFSESVISKYSALLGQWAPGGLRILVFRFDDTVYFMEHFLPKQQYNIKSAFRQEFSALCQEHGGFGAAADLPNGQGIAAITGFGFDVDCMHAIDSIRETICRNCDLSLSCGVSSEICDIEKLSDAFQEALSNCRYRLFHSNSTITPEFVEHVRLQRKQISSALTDDIVHAVKACSYPEISHSIRSFFTDITQDATLPSYKLAYFNTLSQLSKLIASCAENKQNMLVNMLDLLYENCYESLDVLQRDLYNFCILLADTLYEQRSIKLDGGLLHLIYDYVDEHYTSPDLSLTSIAEALHFSPSYLTRYFKEKTDLSLMQYIDRKRFDECKHLLVDTSLPISTIVRQVGYTDEANFSRKFKRHEGVTPSQFRMLQQTE